MKKQVYYINIPDPCTESWNNMRSEANGRYCNSCCKTVIDFSQMASPEIAKYIHDHRGQKLCGRFKKLQLDTNYVHLEKEPVSNLKYAAALAVGLLVAENTMAQTNDTVKVEMQQKPVVDAVSIISKDAIALKGKIVDADSKEPLIGVNITERNTSNATVSDINGEFALPVSKNAVLDFSYVGYMDKSVRADEILKDGTVAIVTLIAESFVFGGPDIVPYQEKKRKHKHK